MQVNQSTVLGVEADLAYTAADCERVQILIREVAGITMTEANQSLVLSRLAKHVRRLGYHRFADYLAFVTGPGGASELQVMVNALTTNTTRFFREPYHFETLANEVMPNLIERAKRGGRIRFWSAGCSSGEEAYSLAAVVLKTFPQAASHDVRILGTDINQEVLSKARIGRYPAVSLEAVPPDLRSICFDTGTKDGDTLQVAPAVKELVTFRHLNFVEPWPLRGPFDAILCRNVAIYMDAPTQSRVWAGLISVLAPDGLLSIGHSERLGPEFAQDMTICGRTTFKKSRTG